MATATQDKKTTEERLEEVGRCALASIVEMVGALECDRERLEELREERDGFDLDEDANAAPDGPGHASAAVAWAAENPDDAAELAELETAVKLDGEEVDEEQARERIQEDALSVQVRGGWHAPGEEDNEPEEYELLLSTGGPAVRIVGELNRGEPTSARLEVQDWFTPWTEHITTGSDHAALMTYAGCFFFGE